MYSTERSKLLSSLAVLSISLQYGLLKDTGKVVKHMLRPYEYNPTDDCREAIPACEDDDYKGDPNCKTDHGERTNYKLRSQPFYQRGNNGKMRKW